MATNETKALDNIIASRRSMLMGGAALAAATMMPQAAKAAATVTAYTDNDILNFALNLEYLEANFYYLSAFGTTIDVANAASVAAGGPAAGIGIGAGTTAAGIQATHNAGSVPVPFTLPAVKAYAIETAIEEGKHVILLRGALGSLAVAQPVIDVSTVAFTTAANAATISGTFNPYTSDPFFLIGAYIFEDVGVTAYHGAASLITSSSILATAASILAVEAYHAGLVRTTIASLDPSNTAGYITLTQKISNLRSTLSLAANPAVTVADDLGLAGPAITTRSVTFDNGSTGVASQLVDADANIVAFSRNTTQVLNIVTGGGALTAGAAATGVFFPQGLNGTFR